MLLVLIVHVIILKLYSPSSLPLSPPLSPSLPLPLPSSLPPSLSPSLSLPLPPFIFSYLSALLLYISLSLPSLCILSQFVSTFHPYRWFYPRKRWTLPVALCPMSHLRYVRVRNCLQHPSPLPLALALWIPPRWYLTSLRAAYTKPRMLHMSHLSSQGLFIFQYYTMSWSTVTTNYPTWNQFLQT